MRWFGLALSMAILPTVAFSQQPVPSSPQLWQLDWQNNYCSITTGDPAKAAVALWLTPGDPEPDLYFIGSPKIIRSKESGHKATVTLKPSGDTFSATVMELAGPRGSKVLRLLRLDEAFPAAFGASSYVRLAGMKEAIETTGSGKAIATLRQCIDDKLSAWGVDAKAFDSLRTPATDVAEHLWFTDSDYPSDALAAGEQGDVIARMNVSATGTVTECEVVASSGSNSLDSATCNSALRVGRFNPAIAPGSQPTPSVRIVRVVWRIAQ